MKYFIFTLVFITSIQFVSAQSPFGQIGEPVGNNEQVGQGQNAGTGISAGASNTVGQNQSAGSGNQVGNSNAVVGGDNAGDGADNTDQQQLGFWQSILETLGINNQSTDKNDENTTDSDKKEIDIKSDDVLIGPDKDNFSNANEGRLLEQGSTNRSSSISCALTNKTIGEYLKYGTCIIVILIPIVVALTVLYFMWGSLKLIGNANEKEHANYKVFLMWGIIIIFVMLSFAAIVRLFGKTLGI